MILHTCPKPRPHECPLCECGDRPMTPTAKAVKRLRAYAKFAKTTATCCEKYNVRVRAKARAEAYTLAAAMVARAIREERGFK